MVTVKQVPENNRTDTPKHDAGNKGKNKGVIEPKGNETLKFKCDQCDNTFEKEITLRKHKNTKHEQPQNKLGEGQFGFIFDVRPGNESEAKELREEWRKEPMEEVHPTREKSSSLSSVEEDDTGNDSEDDDAFLAKYNEDGEFIG